jgi:hypothetical protein
MSRDPRNSFYNRDRDRDRDRSRPPIWGRSDYRTSNSRRDLLLKGSRSRSPPMRTMGEKRRSRSPRKNDKDLDENILSEISKLPEPSELWDNNQFQDNANFGGGSQVPPFQREVKQIKSKSSSSKENINPTK